MDRQTEATQKTIKCEGIPFDILGMSVLELKEFIMELAMENPMIELDRLSEDTGEDLRLKKRAWIEQNGQVESIYYSSSYDEKGNFFATENISIIDERETLTQHVVAQIEKHPTMKNKSLVRYLAERLDEDGYLRMDWEDVEDTYTEELDDDILKAAVIALQSLDPKGIGGADLGECLALQLGDHQHLERQIAEEYLELAASKEYGKIATDLGVEEEEIRLAYKEIQTLNPKPGSGYRSDQKENEHIPDVIVTNFKTHYNVLSCDFIYPQIHLNREMVDLLKSDSGEAREYVAQKMKQINQVRESIKERARILVDVVKAVVECQESFFRYHLKALLPLRMDDLAGALELSEEEMRHAIEGKHLQCYHGIYPLTYFFTNK